MSTTDADATTAEGRPLAEQIAGPPAGERRRVQILGDTVVNQIAAGEVVERPASVVKELVENSIDAGATEITVILEGGGRSLIEVIDDGCGMAREDALLAVERFGTSKVRAIDDLQCIGTHGFRGEALPSIASVSRFTLESRSRDEASAAGVSITINGGVLKDVRELGLAPGTRVSVRTLFYNVPARRKFLRGESAEEGMVRALLLDVALAYPELRVKLRADGREVLHFLPRRTLFDRARELEIGGRTPIVFDTTVAYGEGELLLRGVVSEPLEGLASSGRLRLLVNRRSVRDRLLLRAVRDAYGNFLRPGRHPHGVLALELPPAAVDVNVHPQKTEVRFHRSDLLFGAVLETIRSAFAGRSAGAYGSPKPDGGAAGPVRPGEDGAPLGTRRETISTVRPGEGEPSAGSRFDSARASYAAPYRSSGWSSRAAATDAQFFGSGVAQIGAIPQERADETPQHTFGFAGGEPFAEMRYVGQLFRCYLVLEGANRVALVDMHAAHERVMFFKIKSALKGGGVPAQLLLLPERLKVPPDRIGVAAVALETLGSLGFEVEQFADDSIVVRAIPALLGKVGVESLFHDLFSLPEWGSWSAAVEDHWDAVIARLACHRSVRSGRELEEPEVFELLRALSDAETSGYCPHGRPVITYLRRIDLEQMFGR